MNSVRAPLGDIWAGTSSGFRRLIRFAGPAFVVLVAALLRIVRLGEPVTILNDEKFYVKDAYSLGVQGYEAWWGEGADWNVRLGGWLPLTDLGQYAAHPPLGKWLIAAGLFSGGTEYGWSTRISAAIAGVLVVVLTIVIARRLTGSLLWGTVAGWFVAIDGMSITMSRLGMLDIFLLMFTMLGTWAVIRDRQRPRGLWWRPWLLIAGLAFGAAIATKWSAIWFLAAFGVWVLVMDVLQRRRRGESHGRWGSAWRHALLDFAHLVPVALATYVASWVGWFASSGGYGRQWAETPANAWGGALAWVPRALQSWLHLQAETLAENATHPSDAPTISAPIEWLFLLHPTHTWNLQELAGTAETCDAELCGRVIVHLPNPLLWIAGLIAVLVLVVTLWRRRDWQIAVVLVAIAAGYVPWFFFHRPTFMFYLLQLIPFVAIALVLVLRRIVERFRGTERSAIARWGVAGFVLLVTLVSAAFLPAWLPIWVPSWWTDALMWLPSWTGDYYLPWTVPQ